MFRERGATGFEWDPRGREIFVNLEYMIEHKIAAERIETKKMDVYKGTPKKWQVLDDRYFTREEIEKVQIAIKAPLPEELEMYKEKHSKPMTLPINNKNVQAWRDEPAAASSADFDPRLIQYDRERRKKFFEERYEKPKELTA